MVFLATVDPSPRPQPMKFPVFSQLAGNLAIQRRVRSRLPPPAESQQTLGPARRRRADQAVIVALAVAGRCVEEIDPEIERAANGGDRLRVVRRTPISSARRKRRAVASPSVPGRAGRLPLSPCAR
jgi:hypothetical protein